MNTEEDSEAGTARNGSQHGSETEHNSMKEVRAIEGWRRKSEAQPVTQTMKRRTKKKPFPVKSRRQEKALGIDEQPQGYFPPAITNLLCSSS